MYHIDFKLMQYRLFPALAIRPAACPQPFAHAATALAMPKQS